MLRKITKIAGFLALVFFGLGLLAAMLGAQGGGWKTIRILAFGWFDFLQRTLPNVTVNWSAMGMVLLCSSVIVVCMQWFCRWLRQAIASEAAQPWRWRWTFALFASLWLTFGIVLGASGAARHIKWLAESNEPLYRERVNYAVEMRMTALESKYLLDGSEMTISDVQAHLVMSMARRARPLGLIDRYQYVFLTNSNNGINSAVIIPRDPEAQRRFGFVTSSEPGERIHIEQLPKHIVSD